jgi:hypothetical protein
VALVLNDHYLKQHHASWLTGKLSDVAFMILSPLWLYSAWLGWSERRGSDASDETRRRALLAAIGLIAVTFTLMQTTALGDAAFRWGLGALQYPFRVLWALCISGELVSLSPVRATMDRSDLLCLPVLFGTWRMFAPRSRRTGFTSPSTGLR